MDQFTRRIIGFGVQAIAVDGPGLCRMFNQAISGHALPSRLSTDHDPLFQFHRWQANPSLYVEQSEWRDGQFCNEPFRAT
jgi:hypothetical protein